MKALLVNYNFDPTWLKDYPELEVTIYDRSDDKVERNLQQYGKVFTTRNIGDVDHDKLSYLIQEYDTLPETFLWGKTNLFKYANEELFKQALKRNLYAPLLKMDHRTYSDKFGKVNYYQGNMYYERADSWFFNAEGIDVRYFKNWQEWCQEFQVPERQYIPFPPGGNFILTKEKVHQYSKDFYEKMRSTMPHSSRPVEAQCAERSYHLLWR